MGDGFLKLQEMCSFSQNVCIEVYGILNTRLTPILGVKCTFMGSLPATDLNSLHFTAKFHFRK